jgi:hypothetical protein
VNKRTSEWSDYEIPPDDEQRARATCIRSPSLSLDATLSAANTSSNIYAWLLAIVESILNLDDSTANTSIIEVIDTCIDLFLQYMFPSTPIAHEGTLREAASIFLPENHASVSETGTGTNNYEDKSFEKCFTLITALCAFVASVMPETLLPKGVRLTSPFLTSSRAMFKLYEDHDLEHPDSTSLTIRIWQSNALQNSTGRREGAWHMHSEASLLALRLRLYDESAVSCESNTESRLLRMNFWLLYSADKAAAALGSRISVLNEPLFDSDLSVRETCADHEPLLAGATDSAQSDLERQLSAGFHLKTKVWAAGAHLITEIKEFSRRRKRPAGRAGGRDTEKMFLSGAYIEFTTLIYKLPEWLQSPGLLQFDDTATAAYQKTCFWVQRSNIMTAYHCLKLMILQRCIDQDLLELLGLTGQPLVCAMRKVEIIQDFLNELQIVPFVCYKAQGEAGVGSSFSSRSL